MISEATAATHLLDVDRIADDLGNPLDGQLVDELSKQQAREVGVESLVSADELVREAQPGHQAPLLEPEDRAEATRKEDSLRSAETMVRKDIQRWRIRFKSRRFDKNEDSAKYFAIRYTPPLPWKSLEKHEHTSNPTAPSLALLGP